MPDEPVLEVLCRCGDLSLVRSRITGKVGLLRDEFGEPMIAPAAFDRAEWRWLAVCAVPLALQVLGPDPEARPGVPVGGQATLPVADA